MWVVLLFSQLMLVVFSLVIPLVIITIYGYVKKEGWKPILWGIVDSIGVLFLVRMIIPLLLFDQGWFQTLLNNTPLYISLYSLSMALAYSLFGWIHFYRFQKKLGFKEIENKEGRGLMFGLSEGFAYEALFIGFNGLSSLLSDYAPSVEEAQNFPIWLSIIEAWAMMILFSTFSLQIQQAQAQKNWVKLALVVGEIFLFFWLGFSWQSIFGWARIGLEVVLILTSLLAIWWMKKQGLFHHLFAIEEEPKEEEPLSTKEILAMRKK